jgi:hypothetical protein
MSEASQMRRRRLPRALGALTLAFLATALLMAALASSALATATTTKTAWYSGATAGSVSALTGKPTITAEIGEDPNVAKHFFFKTALEERSVSITTGTASCVECVVSNELTGLAGPETAQIRGKLSFGEATVTVSEGHCVLAGGKLTTNTLMIETDYMEGETWIARMFPEFGPTPISFTIEKEGALSCPVAGTYSVAGFQYAAFEAKTGAFQQEQTLHFSKAISSAASGETPGFPATWLVKAPKVRLFETYGTLKLKIGGASPYFGMK